MTEGGRGDVRGKDESAHSQKKNKKGKEGKRRKEGEGREREGRDGGKKERMRKKALTEKIEMEANLLERTRTLLSKGTNHSRAAVKKKKREKETPAGDKTPNVRDG